MRRAEDLPNFRRHRRVRAGGVATSYPRAPQFASVLLKIERAKHHLWDLRRELDLWQTHNPSGVTVDSDEHGRLRVSVQLYTPIPDAVPMIIADAANNLQAALDHLTWEMIGRDHGTQHSALAFPTGRIASEYERSVTALRCTDDATQQMFFGAEAYPGGNGESLWKVRQLCNIDKHRHFVPVLRLVTFGGVEVAPNDGERVTVKPRAVRIDDDGRGSFTIDIPGARIVDHYNLRPTPQIHIEGTVDRPIDPPAEPVTLLEDAIDYAMFLRDRFQHVARQRL